MATQSPTFDCGLACTTYRSVKTVSGYPFDVAKSALQKFIRRGDFDHAMIMAVECFSFRFIEGGGASFTNFVNRLKIATLEDIGPAFPALVFSLAPLMRQLTGDDAAVARAVLGPIIWLMCKCPHAHFYSHVRASPPSSSAPTYPLSRSNFELEKEDEPVFRGVVSELDSAIRHGDANGAFHLVLKMREMKHPNRAHPGSTAGKYGGAGGGSRVGFLVFALLRRRMIEQAGNNLGPHLIEIEFAAREWYRDLKSEEDWLCIVHPLMCYLMSMRGGGIYLGNVVPPPANVGADVVCKLIKLPSFVFDKHTSAGRTAGRNTADFAVGGALVAYQDAGLMYLESGYRAMRIRGQEIPREDAEYKMVARAQITTSSTKTDVYMAVDREGRNVVVKGPFKSYEVVHRIYQLTKLGSLFTGVHTTEMDIRLLVVADIRTAMGLRVGMVDQVGYFLVCPDLHSAPSASGGVVGVGVALVYPTKTHPGSVKWPATTVIDWDAFYASRPGFGRAVPSQMDEMGCIDFINQLAFRYMFEFGDFAQRNFVSRPGAKPGITAVYNLDMERLFVGQTFKIGGDEKAILKRVYVRHRAWFEKLFVSWLGDGNFAVSRWVMVERIAGAGDVDVVARVKGNLRRLMDSQFDALLA